MSIEVPFSRFVAIVQRNWLDPHGHLSVGACSFLFEEAARAFFRHLDISQAYRERSNHAFFALEQQFTFERAVGDGDEVEFTSQIVGWTSKRIVCLHAMLHSKLGYCAVLNETLYAHIDLLRHRAVPLPEDVQARLRPVIAAHLELPSFRPTGRFIAPIASG